VKLDFDKGTLGKREDYMKNMTQGKQFDITNSNQNSANYGKKIGEMIDYSCPRGHKFSFEFPLSEMKNV
jgi:hypothetical protein